MSAWEPATVTAARRVVDNAQAERVDGILLDAYTASVIVQVYDALGEEARQTAATLTIDRLAHVCLKIANRRRG